MATIGELIRQRREALGLTQRELGLQVGISHTYIYNLEKGKNDIPGPDVMGPLAKALGIAEETLLQSVGYLKNRTEQFIPRPLGPAETWRQIVEAFDGDVEQARRFVHETLGYALEE